MRRNVRREIAFKNRIFARRKKNDKIGEIGNVSEEVVDLVRQINLEVNSNDVQELLNSYNQELTIDELIKTLEQDIEKLESLKPIQSEDRMAVRNLTEDLSLIEKRLQILEL
ncbi:hypothetical protein TNCV_1404161 [Trichonephila clavipes]|nr:hypothetical protein TNCV_1404161 [Trichonephila clavipes]